MHSGTYLGWQTSLLTGVSKRTNASDNTKPNKMLSFSGGGMYGGGGMGGYGGYGGGYDGYDNGYGGYGGLGGGFNGGMGGHGGM